MGDLARERLPASNNKVNHFRRRRPRPHQPRPVRGANNGISPTPSGSRIVAFRNSFLQFRALRGSFRKTTTNYGDDNVANPLYNRNDCPT